MSCERRSRSARPRRISRSRVCSTCSISLAQIRPLVHYSCPNPSRINTSANSSFFIKSLIMNDLKSNRISKRGHKSPRINTSETGVCKPFRINTSKKHRGEGWNRTGLEPCLKFARTWLNCDPQQSAASCVRHLCTRTVGSSKGNTATGPGICRDAAGGALLRVGRYDAIGGAIGGAGDILGEL